jgi:hypothetical protein
VVGADGDTNEDDDEAFLLTVAGECDDDEDERRRPLVVAVGGGKTREVEGTAVGGAVLAANRVGWEAGLKKVEVNERDESERTTASCTFVERRCGRSGSPGSASTRPSARKQKRETR